MLQEAEDVLGSNQISLPQELECKLYGDKDLL